MKRLIAILIFFIPVLLIAQGDGDVASSGTLLGGIAGALIAVVLQFLSGIATKAKQWGIAWIELRITKLTQKRTHLIGSASPDPPSSD